MKKKNLAYGIAILSIFTLASCGSQSFTKDRGQVDETLPSVEIPDVLKHDALSYTVKHELENENGGYDTVYVQNLDGNKGEYTLAEALEYKGYTPLPFEQVLINDESVVVEIKYKANELKLTLQDIISFEQQQMARKPYRYLILGDEKELDIPSLEKIAPIRRLTLEEVFGY